MERPSCTIDLNKEKQTLKQILNHYASWKDSLLAKDCGLTVKREIGELRIEVPVEPKVVCWNHLNRVVI